MTRIAEATHLFFRPSPKPSVTIELETWVEGTESEAGAEGQHFVRITNRSRFVRTVRFVVSNDRGQVLWTINSEPDSETWEDVGLRLPKRKGTLSRSAAVIASGTRATPCVVTLEVWMARGAVGINETRLFPAISLEIPTAG